MTTTEDNEARDKGALDVMASAIGTNMILRKSPGEIAEAGFDALAAEGYSVVRTEDLRDTIITFGGCDCHSPGAPLEHCPVHGRYSLAVQRLIASIALGGSANG